MLGAFLALLSAATFGMNVATLRRGVLGGTVVQAIAVTNVLAVPLLVPICFAFGAFSEIGEMSGQALGWFIAAGIVHFVFGRYANYRATRALGAAQSGPIQQVGLLVSLALALIFLGESLTPLRAFGIVLILVSPILLLRQRATQGEIKTRSGLRLDYVEGYIWGLLCAAAFGTSPLLIALGLEDGGLLRGLAGGFVSYTAAAVLVVVLMAIPAIRTDVLSIDRESAKWFGATSFFVTVSQVLVFMALSIAPVTVVQPIQRTALLFRVLFGWMLNRDHEVIGISILVATGVSMIGVLAVTINGEALLDLSTLPTWIAWFVSVKWPG